MAVLRFNTNKEEEKIEQKPITSKKVKKNSSTKKSSVKKKASSAPSQDAIHDTDLGTVKVTKKPK